MIEFRPDGSPLEIDATYKEIGKTRYGKKLLSNGIHAVEVVVGKKRELFLALCEVEHRQKPEPRTQVIVSAKPEAEPPAAKVSSAAQVANEQIETDEFLDAVKERYVPQADEWFEAKIVAGRNPNILTLELTTGDRLPCIPNFVTESPGDHVLCLPLGRIGSVRMELIDQGYYRALEFRIEDDPSVLHEEAKVIRWDAARNIGKAKRPCGCHLFIANAADERLFGFVDVGDWIEFDLERSPTRGNWVGVRAKKVESPQTAQGEAEV